MLQYEKFLPVWIYSIFTPNNSMDSSWLFGTQLTIFFSNIFVSFTLNFHFLFLFLFLSLCLLIWFFILSSIEFRLDKHMYDFTHYYSANDWSTCPEKCYFGYFICYELALILAKTPLLFICKSSFTSFYPLARVLLKFCTQICTCVSLHLYGNTQYAICYMAVMWKLLSWCDFEQQ